MQRTLSRRAGSVVLAVPALLGLLLCGCKGSDNEPAAPAAVMRRHPAPAADTPPRPRRRRLRHPRLPMPRSPSRRTAPIVTMVTTKGTIVIKLFPKEAPISCANFEKLVKKGFYNGLTFHRITDLGDPGQSKIVQGGDPNGDG